MDEAQTRPADEQDEATVEVEQDEYEVAPAAQDAPEPAERVTRATPQRRLGTQRAPEGMIRRPEERL